jgi:hypothetical protein
MHASILLYLGSILPMVWGISHLFPTASVVRGFGSISEDNRRIITMEWISEGVALVFLGAVLLVVTILDYTSPVSTGVYWTTVVALNTLSAVSLFTGFRIHFFPFRLCPILFTGSSILILLGMFL